MARYRVRPCPRCNGYLGIVLRQSGRNMPLRAINGHRVQCGHRLAWILIRGKARRANHSLSKTARSNPPCKLRNVSDTMILASATVIKAVSRFVVDIAGTILIQNNAAKFTLTATSDVV